MDADSVATLLARVGQGDREAIDAMFDLVHDELRRVAGRLMNRERASHTLSPTALVHEAYLKLVRYEPDGIESRSHFIAIAARAMRQVLVTHAERRASVKRGAGQVLVTLEDRPDAEGITPEEVLAVDHALAELERIDQRMARVVEYRFFGGLEPAEIAPLLGVSVATVGRDWRMARAWLRKTLGRGGSAP